jgi:AcrR family transcriptional regulator
VAGKRGPYAVGEKRKAQILAETERLVIERGHQALTVRVVAETLGITDAAVYHHFASKDVLLVELLRYRDAKAPERELAPDLVAALTAGVAHSQETPNTVALMADFASRAVDPGHPAHAYFADRYTVLARTIADGIRDRQEAGTFTDRVAAEQLAVLLLAATGGLQTQWLVTRELDMAEAIRALFVLIAAR